MDPEATAVFRFTVWPKMMVEQVEELVLELQGGGDTGMLLPSVSLWNQEIGDWELVDMVWGRYSIPTPDAYVFPPGEVLVRLETDDRGGVNVDSLTITIRGRR